MTGYWRKPDETEFSFVGRFFRTDDVGYMDQDGYIFIVDRIKSMINGARFKVYPRRIEGALYKHTEVAEVCVVGTRTTIATKRLRVMCGSSFQNSNCRRRLSAATSCQRR